MAERGENRRGDHRPTPAVRDRGATRALLLGLLSLPFGVFAPVAIYTGSRSLRRIRRSGGELTGGFPAGLGLVAGIVGAASLVLGIVYWWLAS